MCNVPRRAAGYQDPPPPPPPLRPPPNPPKPPPNPPPPKPPPPTRRHRSRRSAAKPAAERADAAAPAASTAAAPERVEQDEKHEQRQQERAAGPAVARCAWRPDPLQRHLPALGNSADHARDPGDQPASVLAIPELGNHELPCCLAGVPVGDELLEVVADLGPDLTVVDGQQRRAARCPCPSGRCLGRGSRTSSRRTRGCRRRA